MKPFTNFSISDVLQMLNEKMSMLVLKNIRLDSKNCPTDCEKYPLFQPKVHLRYLNLSSCNIDNHNYKLIMGFVLKCKNVKFLGLRNNKIKSLNSLVGLKVLMPQLELGYSPEPFLPSVIIDFRGNQIMAPIRPANIAFYMHCTLLLWNNPVVRNEDLNLQDEENTEAEHIYFAEEGADEYFDRFLYENPEQFLDN